jgi:exosortase/archaeosortase family protein
VHLGATGWLAMLALALWPHGAYLLRRAFDGSDDPLGLAAIVALALLVAREGSHLRLTPHLGWWGASLALALGANIAWLAAVPALLGSLLAALSLAAALYAWWPPGRPRAALALLLVLALPLMASLQFYAGWPLRVLTAEISAALLQFAGLDALRSGATLLVNGRLVLVDAPCSGVQMAWLAYFCATVAAATTRLPDAGLLRRLPWVGTLVLAGNVLRNTVLVALEARPQGLDAAAHQIIGLAALALACALVLTITLHRETRGAQAVLR